MGAERCEAQPGQVCGRQVGWAWQRGARRSSRHPRRCSSKHGRTWKPSWAGRWKSRSVCGPLRRPNLQRCRDAEEFQVLQTVRAGRALWLTRQIARQLGTEAYVPLLLQCLHYAPDPEGDNALKLVARETLRRKYAVGADGLKFCEYLED